MLFRKAETREAETIGFGMLGLLQWIRRKSIVKVDRDTLIYAILENDMGR